MDFSIRGDERDTRSDGKVGSIWLDLHTVTVHAATEPRRGTEHC